MINASKCKPFVGRSQILPLFNEDAAGPGDVWALDHFLLPEDLNAAWPVIQKLCSQTSTELMKLGMRDISISYLLTGRTMPGSLGKPEEEGTGKERRAALVLWLDVLLRVCVLFATGSNRLLWSGDLNKLCELAGDHLRQKLVSSFDLARHGSGSGKQVRWSVSKLAKDQIKAHALAIALTLSPAHEVCLEPWTLIMGASMKVLSDVAGLLGCVVSSQGAGPTQRRTTARLLGPPGNPKAEAARRVNQARRFRRTM